MTDNVSLHQYLQRIWFEVAHAHHPFQEGWRSQSQFINRLGRPEIKGIVTLENGHYLIDSSLHAHPRQHKKPQNGQDYQDQYKKRVCVHKLSAYTKQAVTATLAHWHQSDRLKSLSGLP